ncbi:DUF348 domain-containing protein [Candidatus Saccharibacteria bacterium]|nr:DUF348 domain-containing protein [Candidatus Saccharibacteria bacterium]
MKKKLARKLKRQRKKIVKKSKFLLRHPLIVPVSTFIALFFVGLIGFVMIGGSTQGASDARIVNVFVDGEQRTVTTRSKTVGELIDKLGVDLIPEDLVEPKKDTLILEDDTQVNIYRARPVEVIDRGRVLTLLTAQRAPRLVAHDAGLKLEPEDEATLEKVDATILESSASERLVVERSVEVTLNIYGAIKTLRTTADTVGELLQEEGIEPNVDDTLEPAQDKAIRNGLLVSLNRIGVKTLAVKEPIPFETEIKNDDSLQAGKTAIEREGVNGERAVVYEIIEKDGVEVERKLLQEVITKKPVSAIKLRGTKIISPGFNPSVTVAGDKAALMSAAGIVESDFGYVDYIISHESGWRPYAANSYSGAYGLCQALPGSKMASAGADWQSNPVTQLIWCSGYASGRYGSWGGAYAAWQVQGWW